MRLLISCSPVFSFLWLSPELAYAQLPPAAAYVDHPVASVTIAIEGRATTDPALMEVVQTHTGAPLKMADVRETIDHLYSLGRFEDVQVEAEAAANGAVALRYLLSPIHTVTRVVFKGELGLSEGTLRGRMVERFGETPPLARAAEVAPALEELYRERGYLRATVRVAPPIVEHDPDRATLVFEVTAGPRTFIAHATIAGQPLETPAAGPGAAPDQAGAALRARPARHPPRRVPGVDAETPLLRGVGGGAAAADSPRIAPRPTSRSTSSRDRSSPSSSPATRCRRTSSTSWCRSSAKDRSTRICSKTRRSGSRTT